ncbi:MAG: NAD(P)-dependent oxidoreductase [Rhodothermales bacterium]|nr:NAD(P)-dependent oxidoreductase [Rhodothermales bacterium]
MLFARVLVTGANGLLGQALVRVLTSHPRYDVLATGRSDVPLFEDASCGYVRLDITDATSVKRVFDTFAPTCVVNCAAMTQVDACETDREACWLTNVDAVETLARLCRASGARMVQVSTDFVFDGLAGPYREGDRPDPVNFYGRSKLAGENVLREAGLDNWTIARTVLVYGAEPNLSRSNIALWVHNELSLGNPIRVINDQVRSPTYNVDLANGIELILRYGASGIFHLSGPEHLTVCDFARRIAATFNLDQDLITEISSEELAQTAKRPPRTGFVLDKARAVTGYHPHDIDSALQLFGNRLPVTKR